MSGRERPGVRELDKGPTRTVVPGKAGVVCGQPGLLRLQLVPRKVMVQQK